MYLANAPYKEIAEELGISRQDVQNFKRKLKLASRQKTSYNEAEFIKARQEGLTHIELCKKFHMGMGAVSERIKVLGLSKRKSLELKPKVEKPVTSILPKLEHIPRKEKTEVNHKSNSFFIPPTLAELKRLQMLENMKKAERQYKTTTRDSGYTSILDEVDT